MNILMIIDRYHPIYGGSERQLKQLIPYLVSLGNTVNVVTRKWDASYASFEKINNVPVHRIGIPGNNLFSTFMYLLGLVIFSIKHSRKIDIIHTHGAAALGAVGRILGFLIRKPNIVKIASSTRITKMKETWGGGVILHILKKSNIILSLSKEITEELIKIKTPQERIHCISNGVDPSQFYPLSETEKQNNKKAKGFDKTTPLVICSGRLVPVKGIDTIIKAWPLVLAEHPKAHLLIMGSGGNQKDSIEKTLKESVSQTMNSNITFLGDIELPQDYYQISDLFVLSSHREGFPNSLLEGMACALGCISTNIEGVKKLINDDITGLLFEVNHFKALAQCISKLLNDSTKTQQIGQKAQELIVDQFSYDKISKDYNRLYSLIT